MPWARRSAQTVASYGSFSWPHLPLGLWPLCIHLGREEAPLFELASQNHAELVGNIAELRLGEPHQGAIFIGRQCYLYLLHLDTPLCGIMPHHNMKTITL